MDFEALFRTAAGAVPYGFQRRVAVEGLPELLRAPTGAGKTEAVVLGWLFRRRYHPDEAVRRATPGRLVVVLPMRTLVNQTHEKVRGWLSELKLLVEGDAAREPGAGDQVGLHLLMGGETDAGGAWRLCPERDAVVVGTQDMVLSRALNRGYGASRFVWPVDFGLLHSGTQWVFDEVQLMGPALPTSRQLEAFRQGLGTAQRCASTWMSATVEPGWLATVDNPEVGRLIEVGEEDRRGRLRERLEAPKTVRRVDVDGAGRGYEKRLAEVLAAAHRPGTMTLAIVNSVDRARRLSAELGKLTEAPRVVLHSRFRPPDRDRRFAAALAIAEHGGFVVSTQVVEAGVDFSAATLFTEAAPWASVVQRAGRCNRYGNVDGAVLLWAVPPKPGPYEAGDVAAAVEVLTGLEGRVVTPESLAAAGPDTPPAEHPVLRRRDLVDLFDTAPDLDGNDIDVARFIRGDDDVDVAIAWRDLPDEEALAGVRRQPGRDERCPVPVGEVRRAIRSGQLTRVWWFDFAEMTWVPCTAGDVRPGQVLLADSASGCYSPDTGWDPTIRTRVPPVAAPPSEEGPSEENSEKPAGTEATAGTRDTVGTGEMDAVAAGVIAAAENADGGEGSDPLTGVGRWIPLEAHLLDVEAEVRAITTKLAGGGVDLCDGHLVAAAVAGCWHDLGKAHPVFQDMLLSTVDDDGERERLRAGVPWAKSEKGTGGTSQRRWFRHELASVLALLADPGPLRGLAEPDLTLYLVAAHHGWIRLGARAMPDETPADTGPGSGPDGERTVLGVVNGDMFPPVTVGGQVVRPERLSLRPFGYHDLNVPTSDAPDGEADGSMDVRVDEPAGWLDGVGDSWSARMLGLRDRPDLGVFRLGFLEALVRVADWRASARGHSIGRAGDRVRGRA